MKVKVKKHKKLIKAGSEISELENRRAIKRKKKKGGSLKISI
jgi:hypothetical protein